MIDHKRMRRRRAGSPATVLVSGSNGLVGREVVDALAVRGRRVVSYDHAPGDPLGLSRLLEILRERRIGGIVHAASESAPPLASGEMPVADVVADVNAALHVLEAARMTGVTGRIVLLSSAAVYGDSAGPIEESSPLRPRSPHAVSNVMLEQLGGFYGDLYGLNVLALRLGQPYGRNLRAPAMLWALLTAAVKGESLRIATGADQSFNLVHAHDVSRGVLAALEAPRTRQRVFNISGGESHSLAQVTALIRERFPASRLDIGPGGLSDLDRQGALDIRAADRELGYRPLWGLARGLDDWAEGILARRQFAPVP